eukprot:jgi/Mesen1/6967/ME000360S06223
MTDRSLLPYQTFHQVSDLGVEVGDGGIEHTGGNSNTDQADKVTFSSSEPNITRADILICGDSEDEDDSLAAIQRGASGSWPDSFYHPWATSPTSGEGFMDDPESSRKVGDYQVLDIIAAGIYSTIYKVRDSSGDIFALKKLNLVAEASPQREIEALQRVASKHIVHLHKIIASSEEEVMLVFEYMHLDLGKLLRDGSFAGDPEGVRRTMSALLRGVAACHAADVIHRDIKPSNCLVGADGALKLADFGSARHVLETPAGAELSPWAGTRWYRAPELLYGATWYTSAVDMWSVGCVFAELLTGSALFPGGSDIDQVLGTPDAATWPGLASLPDYGKLCFDGIPITPWREI